MSAPVSRSRQRRGDHRGAEHDEQGDLGGFQADVGEVLPGRGWCSVGDDFRCSAVQPWAQHHDLDGKHSPGHRQEQPARTGGPQRGKCDCEYGGLYVAIRAAADGSLKTRREPLGAALEAYYVITNAATEDIGLAE
jgi:hypothetical protein